MIDLPPGGTRSAWDKLQRTESAPIRRKLDEETPYRIVWQEETYEFIVTSLTEDEQYFPSIDTSVPLVIVSGHTRCNTRVSDSVLIYHVDNVIGNLPVYKHGLALAVVSRPFVDGVEITCLRGYGSVALMGPLRHVVSEDEQDPQE